MIEALVVIGLIFILLALLMPATSNIPTKSDRNECVNQLREIDTAEQMWAVDHKKTTNDVPSWRDLEPYLKTNQMRCPGGGIYTLARAGQAPRCSVPEHQALFLQYRRPPVFP